MGIRLERPAGATGHPALDRAAGAIGTGGRHVGAATDHTTGRTTTLAFRLASALFGHAGIEWDFTACTDTELDQPTA
ncbi:alpha-galactosidase [Streptomyces bobili]